MSNFPAIMRRSAALLALAAALFVQACTTPRSGTSASFYSGNDYVAALEAAMTSDNGGD
jgi:hypothetical protein